MISREIKRQIDNNISPLAAKIIDISASSTLIVKNIINKVGIKLNPYQLKDVFNEILSFILHIIDRSTPNYIYKKELKFRALFLDTLGNSINNILIDWSNGKFQDEGKKNNKIFNFLQQILTLSYGPNNNIYYRGLPLILDDRNKEYAKFNIDDNTKSDEYEKWLRAFRDHILEACFKNNLESEKIKYSRNLFLFYTNFPTSVLKQIDLKTIINKIILLISNQESAN